MNRMSLRTLLLSLLAALVLAGCQSTGDAEVAPEPEVQEAPAEAAPATPPMVTPAPRPVTNDEGFPDSVGPWLRVYFEFDRTELKSGPCALAEHADYLKETVAFAHTRAMPTSAAPGSTTSPWDAGPAVQHLQSMGVASSQLRIVSYGEERPVDPRSTESAWSKNRRVELAY